MVKKKRAVRKRRRASEDDDDDEEENKIVELPWAFKSTEEHVFSPNLEVFDADEKRFLEEVEVWVALGQVVPTAEAWGAIRAASDGYERYSYGDTVEYDLMRHPKAILERAKHAVPSALSRTLYSAMALMLLKYLNPVHADFLYGLSALCYFPPQPEALSMMAKFATLPSASPLAREVFFWQRVLFCFLKDTTQTVLSASAGACVCSGDLSERCFLRPRPAHAQYVSGSANAYAFACTAAVGRSADCRPGGQPSSGPARRGSRGGERLV